MENFRLNEIDKRGFFTKLSRTLYIGNLNENIDDATLYQYFGQFGDIISINIKKGEYVGDRPLKIYAFIKYFDSNDVIFAILKMNGVNIKGCHLRLGFGKSYPSKCVWITGINELGDNYTFLLNCLADCGTIINYSIDHINKRALVNFKEIADADAAINKIKNGLINGIYLRGDYASTECQIKFAEFFNKQNDKKHLSIERDNVDIQNTPISNVNEQKLAVGHCGRADNTSVASKEFTSEMTCIWVDGIADSVTNEYLESHFRKFGPIHKCLIDRSNKCALLYFQEELHAQSAVTGMNGSYIEGKPVYVRLASLRCRACDVSNINNDNVTIQLKDNTAQSSLYSARHVDPSCKCKINNATYPININDPRNNSINANNAQYTSQNKYLNTYNIDIPKYSSKTIYKNNSSITIIFNEYPPERLKPPTHYPDSDILSLPLPEFAKNISKELTSTSSRYSLSSNASGNQDTCTFNVHHDEMVNYGLKKTDNQDKKQDQNNNHPPKSNYKMLESAAELQNLFFEEAKKFQDVLDKHTPKEFIQSQSSQKFKDQQISSSLGTLSTSGSSKYSPASVFQSQYNSPSDTQPKLIPQNSKTSLLDSQILPSDPKVLIDPKCASAIDGTISDINGLFFTKKNNCTISNSMHTSDAINTDFVNPIPKDADSNKTFLEIGYKFQDEYPKDWVTPSNWLTNTPNHNCVEKLDHWCSSETSKKEKEGQKKLQSTQKSLDGFVAKKPIELVVQPNIVDVEKSTNIDEEKIDDDICEKSIANILLSLKTNYQNKIIHNKTKDKIKKTDCNELAGGISNNGNSENNKSVSYNHVNINEYEDNESQSISSTRSMGSKSHNIKPNKIQGEVEKTNVNEYISKHLNIKNNKEWQKPILYFDHHEKKNKHCKPKIIVDPKSIEPKFSKSKQCELDKLKIKQTNNKKKETKNKDCKFDKEPTTIEEEKQNLNILKSHENNKSKKYIKKVDGNIASSYCSTENLLKRSLSNPSEYQNDSKRSKTDNKTYKNNSIKTSKHHSPLSKPSISSHNNLKPENKNKNKLDKTPNRPGIRGWINGYSMLEILSNVSKVSISNKVKT